MDWGFLKHVFLANMILAFMAVCILTGLSVIAAVIGWLVKAARVLKQWHA